jgi:hypothetical protein
MRKNLIFSAIALLAVVASLFATQPQTKPAPGETQGGIPDFSGNWVGSPPSFDLKDPGGQKVGTPEDDTPYQPWALAKLLSERPGFGRNSTFENVTDPRIKYCDPIGVPRIYNVPNLFKFIQTKDYVYILHETGSYWRQIAMNKEHPKDPGPSWWGDSVGKYEGDTLVVDTIGFNDKTWLDHLGRPHSEDLHLTERWRRVDPNTLQLDLVFDDPKAYTRPFPGRKIFHLAHREFIDYSCSYSENEQLQKNMINGITAPK